MLPGAKIKTSILILSSILLIAVIALAYGHFQDNLTVTNGSLIIIFPISLSIPLQSISFKERTKRKFTLKK